MQTINIALAKSQQGVAPNIQTGSSTLLLEQIGAAVVTWVVGGIATFIILKVLDAIIGLRDAMLETKAMGFAEAKAAQWALGRQVRALLAGRGIASVAAEGFEAPGVVVSYTDDPDIQNGAKFRSAGYQIAAGVPLQVDVNEGWSLDEARKCFTDNTALSSLNIENELAR